MMTIKQKILMSMIILTTVCAIAVLVTSIIFFTRQINDSADERINMSSRVAQDEFRRFEALSYDAARSVSNNRDIIQGLIDKNFDDLLLHGKEVQSIFEFDFCTITDTDGVVLVRTHEPEKFGDSIAGQANVKSALSGASLTALEEGTAVRLSIRTGTPVYDDNNVLIGVVSLGYRLDNNDFVDMLKDVTGNETTIFLGDERISTTVLNDEGGRAIGTKADPNVSAQVLSGKVYEGRAMILGRKAITQYVPLYAPGNVIIGMLFVGEYLDIEEAKVGAFIITGAIITLIILAIAVIISTFISNSIEKQITNIIGKIKNSAFSIKNSATGLSEISDNLANDSTKQAAATEEASATMAGTISMIAQNAENTHHAAQLAQKTKTTADSGRIKMQEMMQSMYQLKDSSDTISQIIRTIDDLAFQTNLLAINATIEAARAGGESGKSFGVVAEEVRNLARKSSDAAADTSGIIEKNIALTNKGRIISAEVSSSLESIISEFDALNSIIGEINAASEEQSSAMQQINTVISQMGKSTQQNAAMSEETTASSHGLAEETVTLEQIVNEASKIMKK